MIKTLTRLKFLIFLFLSIFSQTGYAQINGVQSQMINLPAAPEAAALKEYVDIPISEYTGTASVNIPLCALQSKEVTVPVSVAYHSAGNRVTEEASWVGLGWSLNAGGVITREIKDKDDFGFIHPATGLPYPGYYSNFDTQLDQLPGPPLSQDQIAVIPLDPIEGLSNFTVYFSPLTSNDNYTGNDGNLYTTGNTLCRYTEIDAEPDLYSFNFMGYSGKFVLDDNKNFIPLTDHGLQITYEDPGWKIITQDGTSYLFGTAEEARQKTYSLTYQFNSIDVNNNPSNYSSCLNCTSNTVYDHTRDHISSWFLREIQTVNGRRIIFDYDKDGYDPQTNLDGGITPVPGFSENWLKIYHSCFVNCGAPNSNLATNQFTASVSVLHYDRVDLKKIYSPSPDIRTTILFNQKQEQRLDLDGGKILDNIEVLVNNELVKKINFTNSYFTSSTPSPTNDWVNLVPDLPGASTLVNSNNNLKRLKLDNIQICGENNTCLEQPYSFSYNTTLLPAKTSMAQDYWGYYNGKLNKTLIPSIYYVREVTPPGDQTPCALSCEETVAGDCTASSILGGDKKADEQYLKASILETVTAPLGGSTTFDYEIHQFNNVGDDLKFSSALNELGTSFINTFNCLDVPNCTAPPLSLNYPNLEIEVGDEGASLCGVNGVPIYINANWASIGCTDTNLFPTFFEVVITGVDNPNFSETIQLDATTLLTNPGDTWNGKYEAYFGGDILLAPTTFLDPGTYQVSMTVPTGLQTCGDVYSASINVAELSLSSLYKTGGGLRVAQKTTNDANGNRLTTSFDYTDTSGVSTGVLNAIPDFAGEGGIKYVEGETSVGVSNISLGYQVNIASSSLTTLSLMHAPGMVGYSSVTKSYEDQDNITYGKEIKTFQNDDFSVSSTASNYAILGVPRFYNANNGNLLKHESFNAAGTKVKETTSTYQNDWNEFDWIWTGKIMCNDCLVASGNTNLGPADPDCSSAHSLFIFYYSYIPQWHRLQSTVEKTWGTDGSGPLVMNSSYTYDNDYYVPKTYTISGANVGMTTEIKYVQDIIAEGDPEINTPALNEMLSRNMTAIPIWEKTSGTVQSGSKLRYEFHNNLIIPTYAYAIEGDINTWEPQYQLMYTDNYVDDYPDEMLKEAYTNSESYTWSDGLLTNKTYIGWTQSWNYNTKRQLTSTVNVDGTGASYTYDDLQRLETSSVFGKDATLKSTTAFQYQYGGAGGGNKLSSTITFDDGAATQETEQTFDGFGRALATTRLGYTPQGADKVMNYVDYDGFGRQEEAYNIGQDPIRYQYEFSPLSRMLQVDNPDGSIITNEYGVNADQEVTGFVSNTLFKVKTTNENGHISETFTDGLERTRVSKRHLSNTESADTYYNFDNFGNIGTVTTPLDKTYTYTYDSHNRLFKKTIPGGGDFVYEYYDNDLLFKSILANGHTTFNYYDDYDRLTITSLDGPQGAANNIVENTYDLNNGAANSAYLGKQSQQRVRVLGTDDWLNTDFTYDLFGRVINQVSDNYVNGQDVMNSTFDYADNLLNDSRVHSSSYSPNITINTNNTLDQSFRIRQVDHQIDNYSVVNICGMSYDNEDRLLSKQLYGNDPASSLLQNINYGYNSRGWLTNINQIDEGFEDEHISECVLNPTCDKCDYTASISFDGNRQIIGIYANGGQFVDLPGYPYAIYEMTQMEIDLENWLTQNGIQNGGVNITTEGGAYITITQSAIPFNTIVLSDKNVITFDETNCTGSSGPDSEICELCNRNGYNCNDCPYWDLQDHCTTCQDLGIIDCTSCAFDNDPCTRCANLGYTDCSTCPLTLDAIKPISLKVDYNHSDLSNGTSSSLIKINEKSKYFDHNQSFKIVEKQSTQMVGTNAISNNLPTHTMEIDLYAYWINANTHLAVLDSVEALLIAELNTAGISSTQVQNDFVDAVEQSLSLSWKNTTSTTPEPQYDTDNPDLFSMEISYGTGDNYTTSPGQLNGNISGLTWKVAGKAVQNYSFWYDQLDRLNQGLYSEVQGGQVAPDNKYGVAMDYDLEGNIEWLTRRGVTEICDEGSNLLSYDYEEIDNLTYTYNTENRLASIAETSNQDYGYKGAGGNFAYDVAGNMTVDNNKNMTVVYNYLNLPTLITFTQTGSTIRFTYDALGNKLQKVVDGVLTKEYSGGIEYNEGVIEAIYHQEGRVTYDGPKLNYEYFLKDHLGNTRVVFADLNKDGYLQPYNEGGGSLPVAVDYTEILQENHYYPFGMTMDGPWQETVNDPENAYLYNGKELNEDFGLDWLDYGARWYDPAIGRWNAVDPLAEEYFPLSPYVYTNNNPVRFIDPNGMYFTQRSYKHINKMYSSFESRFKSLDKKIANARDKNKDGRVERLEKAKLKLQKQFSEVDEELQALANSNQEYDIFVSNKYSESGSIPGTGIDRGAASFNFSNGSFEIILPNARNIGMIAHELKHAYQFETGRYSVGPELNGPHKNLLYDKTDEVEAYARGSIFGQTAYGINDLPADYDNIATGPVDITTHPNLKHILNASTETQKKAFQNVANTTGHAFRVNGKTYYKKR